MHPVEGVAQHYAWGDTEFIPRLVGTEPDGRPWAELWFGTHPHGPSHLGDGTPLAELTGELPYLLKVLATDEPLSLQAHPNAEQAAAGHRRGVYPDPNPKPELLCALTRFEAFCGVRAIESTLQLLRDLGIDDLARVVAADGPLAALEALYHRSLPVERIVDACRGVERPECEWVVRLAERYAGDPSVAATLLLNLVVLEPGQALRLDAGTLHAYLSGAGIELMGASDNVVRGGLTAKEVDVELLLDIVDATPLAEPMLEASDRYELPAADVALLRLSENREHLAIGHELALALDGTAWYLAPGERLTTAATTFVVTPV